MRPAQRNRLTQALQILGKVYKEFDVDYDISAEGCELIDDVEDIAQRLEKLTNHFKDESEK